ncbi:uncharacterized protein DUF4249 [Maribacter spongiicola]|uniref:Uncharacterized protein DUF4249 n=2 Tax=Maribacter spongiicola TaxID=1206753 RepID=A0A4R7K261_9FLAO|nr:uncharacterized protein DUF4249 [Maribacter spongiicola]
MQVLLALSLGIFMHSCIDPFEIEATEFNSALVVEGTITNQYKTQRILVSRTFPLDTVLMSGVSRAKVEVKDSNGNLYEFKESSAGVYTSKEPFTVVFGHTYVLTIQSNDGKTYVSEDTAVPATSSIDNLYAERNFKDDGAEEGMFIYLDSYDATGESKYYRYEYDETYKIIAPFYSFADAYVVSRTPNPAVDIRVRTKEERVCYKTVSSNTIIQENTTNLSEDKVNKFPIRFINRDNFILSHRYSVLVRQYVQNRAAFAYYKTLETLSGTESLFSQIQTGLLEGNIKALTDEENVIGFFQVSTVSEKRLFFNYTDFFPNEELPNFVSDCPIVSPPIVVEGGATPLLDAIENNLLKYYGEYTPPQDGLIQTQPHGPYDMVYTVCGDCTVLGSNVVPDFWIE